MIGAGTGIMFCLGVRIFSGILKGYFENYQQSYQQSYQQILALPNGLADCQPRAHLLVLVECGRRSAKAAYCLPLSN